MDGGIKLPWLRGTRETPWAELPCGRALPSPSYLLLSKAYSGLDVMKSLLEMLLPLCSISEASNTRIPVLVDFSFPLPEKKAGKEKKRSKKVSSEGEPIADGSAEVHKKKKKVCARPWDGVPWGELFGTTVVMLVPAVCQAGTEEQPCSGLAGGTEEAAVNCG